MKCIFQGSSKIEILISNGFNGNDTPEIFNKIIDKSLVDEVIITLDKNIIASEIKNFSIFFRYFFTDFPNITILKADIHKIGIYETFKDFFLLVDNYQNKNIKYGQEIFLLDLGLVSQLNSPDNKGIKYFLEHMFGSGFLKHICKINIELENGFFDSDINSRNKESFDNLALIHKNLENIPNIHDLIDSYFRKEI